MVDWVCCVNNCNLKKKGNMFIVGTRDICRPIVGRYSDQLWAECQDQFLFLGNRPREKIRARVVYVLSVNCPQLMST